MRLNSFSKRKNTDTNKLDKEMVLSPHARAPFLYIAYKGSEQILSQLGIAFAAQISRWNIKHRFRT